MGVLRGLFVRKDSTKGTGPRDARMALAGLLVPSSAIGARAGVMAGPGNPVTVTGTSGWQYSVSGGQVVASRSEAQGPVVFALDGPTLTAAVQPAPASGSRWDLIYVQHKDVDQGDADSAAAIGVTSGAAAGSPVKPTADVPAGALVIAEAEVKAGATSTSHANVTITRTAPLTVARGGVVPVRSTAERAALAAYEGMLIARLDTGNVERYHQGAWGPSSDIAALTGLMEKPIVFTAGVGRYEPTAEKVGRLVKLTGSVSDVPVGTTIVATLPDGYRPRKYQWYPAGANVANPRGVAVYATGEIAIYKPGGDTTASYVSLTGVSFFL